MPDEGTPPHSVSTGQGAAAQFHVCPIEYAGSDSTTTQDEGRAASLQTERASTDGLEACTGEVASSYTGVAGNLTPVWPRLS